VKRTTSAKDRGSGGGERIDASIERVPRGRFNSVRSAPGAA
jgi:hypothetical protein